jgi:hypothetical protein
MNPDFRWTIPQAFGTENVEEFAQRNFHCPHDGIWQDGCRQFATENADHILARLSPACQTLFLSACLAGYLLNPRKAPPEFSSWFQQKSVIGSLPGLTLTWEQLSTFRWHRCALPGVDLREGWNNKVVYALICALPEAEQILVIPPFARNCLNDMAERSVQLAAQLAAEKHPGTGFIFWPILESSQSISGNSLGLPVYLSFLSASRNSAIPNILATGALGDDGKLLEVGGLERKFRLAHIKKFTSFIYPLTSSVKPLDSIQNVEAHGVEKLTDSEGRWFGALAPDHGKLLKLLMPAPFENDLQRFTEGFVGRATILREVEQWANAPDGGKIFWITGGPGMGKSALAATIATSNSKIAAVHFCDYFSEAKRDPAKLVRSVLYQLAMKLPGYANLLDNLPVEQQLQEYLEAYTLFENLLIEPLAKEVAPPDGVQIILIDALDEATKDSRNGIAQLLAQLVQRTPPWLRFLITSRPEPEISSQLYPLQPRELEASSAENRDDGTLYLANRIPGISATQSTAILERSEGSFLYLKHICDELTANTLTLDNLDDFPRGLGAVYQRYFERRFGGNLEQYRKEIRPLLCLVAAAGEPLPTSLLKPLLGIKNKMELNDRLDLLGALFPRKKSGAGNADNEIVTPCHLSVVDWLVNKECSGTYWLDSAAGHEHLAEFGWEQQRSGTDLHPYFLVWLPVHLARSDRIDDAVALLKDFDFMMLRAGWKQIGHHYLERMLADYREIRHESLTIEAAFFREHAHILRRGNEEWPAYKILLQLAVEHADNSPLSLGADHFLERNNCDWLWLRRELRPQKVRFTGCLAVMEHDDKVNGALLLKDNRILSWSDDHTLRIWDNNGTLIHILQGHTEKIVGTTILSDETIVSWSENELFYWNQSGNCKFSIKEFKTRILLIFDDGRLLIQFNRFSDLLLFSENQETIIDTDGNIIIDVLPLNDGGFLTRSLYCKNICDHYLRFYDKCGNFVKSINIFSEDDVDTEKNMFSPKGIKLLEYGLIFVWAEFDDTDKYLYILDQNGLLVRKVQLSEKICICNVMAISTDLILIHGYDNAIKEKYFTWNTDGSITKLNNILDDIFLFAFVDGSILTSNTSDFEIQALDNNFEIIYCYKGHSDIVNGACLLSGNRIMTWSDDHTLRIWNFGIKFDYYVDNEFFTELHSFSFETDKVFILHGGDFVITTLFGDFLLCNIKGKIIKKIETKSADKIEGLIQLRDGYFAAWSNKEIYIFDFDDNKHEHYSIPGNIIGSLCLHDGDLIICNGDHIYNLNKATHTMSIIGKRDIVYNIPNGNKLIFISVGRICDLTLYFDKTNVKSLKGHTGRINHVLVSGNNSIITCSDDQTLRIWDQQGNTNKILQGHTDKVKGALLLPDDRILSWSSDTTFRIWDNTGAPINVLKIHEGEIDGVLLLKRKRILSWSEHVLILWSVDSTFKTQFIGHSGRVKGAIALPGNRIVTWGNENILRIWDDEGSLLRELEGHTDEVNGAYLLPENHILSWTKSTMRIWSLDGNCLWESGQPVTGLPYKANKCLQSKQTTVSNTTLSEESSAVLLKISGKESCLNLRWNGTAECRAEHLFKDGRAVITSKNENIVVLQAYVGNQPVMFDQVLVRS